MGFERCSGVTLKLSLSTNPTFQLEASPSRVREAVTRSLSGAFEHTRLEW